MWPKITKISPSGIMKVRLKRKFEPAIKDGWNNTFEDLLIKMQLFNSCLAGISALREHYPEEFFL